MSSLSFDYGLQTKITGVAATPAEGTIDTNIYNPGYGRAVRLFGLVESLTSADFTVEIQSAHDNSTFVSHGTFTCTATNTVAKSDIFDSCCDIVGGFYLPPTCRRYVKVIVTSGTGDVSAGKVFTFELQGVTL